MKKLLSFMVTIAIIATIALLPAEGYSGPRWRLYDDFDYEDGDPDPDRWDVLVDGDSTISIKSGEAKFVHHRNEDPPIHNFLIIQEKPEKIKGIRVTVRVEKLEQEEVGDLLAGIAAFIGNIGDYLVLDAFHTQAGYEKIFGGLSVGPDPSSLPFSLFHGEFDHPIDIINNTFTITTIFSKNVMTYEVDGFGTITRELPEKLDPPDNNAKVLHTVSTNGYGTAVVYFDDVYILR